MPLPIQSHAASSKGILLMNLGTPASFEVPDVRRYLSEFLMDGRVIDIPFLMRLLLVRGIISPFRAGKSAACYRKVWTESGSPLLVHMKLLEMEMKRIHSGPVHIAMRYGNPSVLEALESFRKDSPDLKEVILFPLFPHFAMSSYETAVLHAKKIYQSGHYPFRFSVMPPYYSNEHYLSALCDVSAPYMREFPYDKLLLSYHGIPERHLHKSDPTGNTCLMNSACCDHFQQASDTCYRYQVFQTSALFINKIGIAPEKTEVVFQSRLGRSKWLTPYLALRIQELPSEGVRNLAIACPSFTMDCLETLYEVGMECRDLFIKSGGSRLQLIPCLNSQPVWANAIRQMIESL